MSDDVDALFQQRRSQVIARPKVRNGEVETSLGEMRSHADEALFCATRSEAIDDVQDVASHGARISAPPVRNRDTSTRREQLRVRIAHVISSNERRGAQVFA